MIQFILFMTYVHNIILLCVIYLILLNFWPNLNILLNKIINVVYISIRHKCNFLVIVVNMLNKYLIFTILAMMSVNA